MDASACDALSDVVLSKWMTFQITDTFQWIFRFSWHKLFRFLKEFFLVLITTFRKEYKISTTITTKREIKQQFRSFVELEMINWEQYELNYIHTGFFFFIWFSLYGCVFVNVNINTRILIWMEIDWALNAMMMMMIHWNAYCFYVFVLFFILFCFVTKWMDEFNTPLWIIRNLRYLIYRHKMATTTKSITFGRLWWICGQIAKSMCK